MVWSQTTHHNLQHNAFTDEEASYSKETWKAGHTMKITPSELYDLAWSPNGEAIAAGGTDFVVRIIDVASCEYRERNREIERIEGREPMMRFKKR